MTFVKRNFASYLTASLFDTAVKIKCARERNRARRLKKETANALPNGRSLSTKVWYFFLFSGCRLKDPYMLISIKIFVTTVHAFKDAYFCNKINEIIVLFVLKVWLDDMTLDEYIDNLIRVFCNDLIWKVCIIQKRRGKIEHICFESRTG